MEWTPGAPGSTWERQRHAWECRWQLWEHLGPPATNLGAPATSLGAPPTRVEQSGKSNIFFGNAAAAPGNHSYYLSFNNFQNSCIRFVFWSMYLCIYIGTHLPTVHLDRLQAELESNSRCAWKWPSSELKDTLWGRDRVSLDMHLWRPWSRELRDALWGCDWASLEMHLQAMIERDWRSN